MFFGLLLLSSLPGFQGERAFNILQELVKTGQRYYGAPDRHKAIEKMKAHFACPKWIVQNFEAVEPVSGKTYVLQNLICRFQPEIEARVLLGTHYDTRLWAEKSPKLKDRNKPIVGANDGSSGVAVLAELSHLLDQAPVQIGVDLVLFDGEEFGRPRLGGYCQGSRYMVRNIEELYPQHPKAVIVLDMVGEKNAEFRVERSSQEKYPELYKEIWNIGQSTDPQVFLDGNYGFINDDHSSFAVLDIPNALIIDFDYEHWHTHQDTLDKCSQKSLSIVGDVLWKWLNSSSFAF